jgi:peptide/nickel transport system substrate-binding protein
MSTSVVGRGRSPWTASAILIVVAVLATAACSGTANQTSTADADAGAKVAALALVESDAKPVMGGRLVMGLESESNGWNPGISLWSYSGLLVSEAIFDRLAWYDDKAAIHPFLAQSFDHNPDYTVWTIKLRSGIKFHNGKPVTPEAVSEGLNYLMHSSLTGQAFYGVQGIAVEGDAIVATMSEPWVQFPMLLSTQVGVVADPAWMKSNDSKLPVGTGPFKLDSWEIGNKLTVQKNPDYWNKDKNGVAYPYLDTIEFRVITDSTARGTALEAGDVETIFSRTGSQIQKFQADGKFKVFSDEHGVSPGHFAMLNSMKAPFDDVDARRALAFATDKQAYNDVIANGFNELANGPVAPSSPWYVDSGYPQFDQAEARKLVDKVKAAHGGQFAFEIIAPPGTDIQQRAQLLQQQWADVGIDVTIKTEEIPAVQIRVATGGFQATIWSQFDSPNPIMNGPFWQPSNATPPPSIGLNFARFRDDEVGKALALGRSTTDPAVFKSAVATIQRRFGSEVPYVWLYHERGAVITSGRVVNLLNYTLPDGAKGIGLMQDSYPLYQVWLR